MQISDELMSKSRVYMKHHPNGNLKNIVVFFTSLIESSFKNEARKNFHSGFGIEVVPLFFFQDSQGIPD